MQEPDAPIVLCRGEGEVLADSQSWSSRIKAARDELLLFESSSGPGERGAAPHIHREHADAFYVLEGELLFHVAGEQRSLSVGSFVLAPPELVHGFEVGPEGARYLNLHVPGRAYASLARARRDGIEFDAAGGDSFPPPTDGEAVDSGTSIVLHAGEGERVGTNVVKAARPELSLIEFEVKSGGEVQPHLHRGHSDSFYVLEGELEFRTGDEVVIATAGTFVLSPPGVVHSFRNTSAEPARLLNLHTPGGFVEYWRELVALHEQGIQPDDTFFEHHDVFDPG
ncbi:hypothetical protein BH20ACT14_BH20ACT14_01210 [soil metagenome]